MTIKNIIQVNQLIYIKIINKYYPREKLGHYHQKRVRVNCQYFCCNREWVITIYADYHLEIFCQKKAWVDSKVMKNTTNNFVEHKNISH